MSIFGSDIASSQVGEDILGFFGKKAVQPDEVCHQESVLANDIAKLFNDKDSATFTFYVGKDKKPLYVHKIILQARCPDAKNLEKILKTSEFNILDAEFDDLLEFFRYVYTGECNIPFSRCGAVMAICDTYALKEMRSLILTSLVKNIDDTTACSVYTVLAREKQTESLGKCKKYICENAVSIFSQYLTLDDATLIEFLGDQDLWIDEFSLFECIRKREDRDKFLKFIRYGAIDEATLSEQVLPTDLVPKDLVAKLKEKPDGSIFYKARGQFSTVFKPNEKNIKDYSIVGTMFTRTTPKVYGDMPVFSGMLPNKTYISIKIDRVSQVVGYAIGVTNNKSNQLEKNIVISPSGSRHNCTGSGSNWCKQGDTIGIYFDKIKGTVSFYVNENAIGITGQLEKDTPYYAVVHTRSPNDSFTVDVKMTPPK
jgi:hypothetical protein